MAIQMGVDVSISAGTGLTNYKIHSARLEWEEAEFDVTGAGDSNKQTAFGDRNARMRLECSNNAAAASAAFLFPGHLVTLTFKVNGAGTSYTESFKVQSIGWDWDKRGSGPPQRFPIVLTPHEETLTNATATDGVFTTNA